MATMLIEKTMAAAMKAHVAPIFKSKNITSFYCGFLGIRVEYDRVFARIGGSYDKYGNLKWKVPGGDGEAYELPVEVGFREFREEVTRPNSKVELDLQHQADFISQGYGRCEKHPGGIHAKLFFMFPEKKIVNSSGDMCFRTSLLQEKDDGTILTPFIPLAIEDVWQMICPTHRPAIARAILALGDAEGYYQLMRGNIVREAREFLERWVDEQEDKMQKVGITSPPYLTQEDLGLKSAA